jgi:hypothetical protein
VAFNNTICMTFTMPQPKLSHMFYGKKFIFNNYKLGLGFCNYLTMGCLGARRWKSIMNCMYLHFYLMKTSTKSLLRIKGWWWIVYAHVHSWHALNPCCNVKTYLNMHLIPCVSNGQIFKQII